MQKTYRLGDLSFKADNIASLEESVRDFLAGLKISALVVRESDSVVVEYPDVHDIDANEDMSVALGFCNSRRFGKAKKVLLEFLKKVPHSSEAYRLLAQIAMESRDYGSAIELSTIALRLDPSSLNALILLGNLYARDKDDVSCGLAYYKRASDLYPESCLAVTNYAAALMQSGGDKAGQERLFRKAIRLAPDYLNSYYGLVGLLIEREDYKEAFDLIESGLKNGRERPENPLPLRQKLTEIMIRVARMISKESHDEIVAAAKQSVMDAGGLEVKIEEDAGQHVPARMELAWKYNRDYNLLLVNPSKIAFGKEYVIVHELEKARLLLEGERATGRVMFGNAVNGQRSFIEKTMTYMSDDFRQMIPPGEMDGFLGQLMSGVGVQLMNCPLDFVVRKNIWEKYPGFRAVQIAGEYELLVQALASVDSGVKGDFPKNVIRLNRVMNAVTLMQYRDLFSFDYLAALKLPEDELSVARELYDSCCRVVKIGQACEVWVLVREFLEKLHCEEYFVVVGGVENLTETLRKEESTDQFQRNVQDDPAIGAAVMMHMVDAIRELRAMSTEQIRKTAVEIAMLGMNGINPTKKSGYALPSLGGVDMSGCRALAYYYVSWSMAFPEKIEMLGLPFASEYEQAKALVEGAKG